MNIFYEDMGVNVTRLTLLLFSIIFISIMFGNCIFRAEGATTSLSLTSTTTDLGTLDKTESYLNTSISFEYTYGALARPGGTLPLLLKNQRTPSKITFSVESAPTWCTVSLEKTLINVTLDKLILGNTKTGLTKMSIHANITNILAKTTGKLTIKAEATQNGKLPATSSTIDFTLNVAFIPSLEITIIDPISKPVKSGAWANFSLMFNNTSNEKIKVTLNQTTTSNYFIITRPSSIDIDRNAIKTISIPIRAADINTSINETKKLAFNVIYTMATEETAQGPTQQIEITRSIYYQPEKENAIDFAPVFIGIAIIFLLIIGFFSYLTIRQNQQQ